MIMPHSVFTQYPEETQEQMKIPNEPINLK